MQFCEKVSHKSQIHRYAICGEACAQLDLKYNDMYRERCVMDNLTPKNMRDTITDVLIGKIYASTKPAIDFIYHILDQAYISRRSYNLSDLRDKVMRFAQNSPNHSDYCVDLVNKMHFTDRSYENLELRKISEFPELVKVVEKEAENIEFLYPKMFHRESFLQYYNSLRDNNQPISHELREIAKRYAQQEVEFTKIVERRINEMKNKHRVPRIKDVIFNDPATIVFWMDGTKTVVKCGDYDIYDPEKGLAMAIAKKTLGNQGNYYETFKRWLPEEGEWDTTQPFIDEKSRLDVETAYKMLVEVARNKKATKADLAMAIGDAIGYLGEVLAE